MFVRLARTLALAYAESHAKMSDPNTPNCAGSNFSCQHGITNGAAWYSVAGGEVPQGRTQARDQGDKGGGHHT